MHQIRFPPWLRPGPGCTASPDTLAVFNGVNYSKGMAGEEGGEGKGRAHPGSPGQTAVKRVYVCMFIMHIHYVFIVLFLPAYKWLPPFAADG